MIRCWYRDHTRAGAPWSPAWLIGTPEGGGSYPKCVVAVETGPSRPHVHPPHPPKSLQLRVVPLDEVRIKNPAMDIFSDPERPDAPTASEKIPPAPQH